MALSLFLISTVSEGQSNPNIKPKTADCIADAEQIRQLVYNRDILLAQRNKFIEKVALLEADLVNYQQLVIAKNNEVSKLESKIAIDSSTVETYKSSIQTYKDQVADLNLQIGQIYKAYDAAIRKQKRKTTWSQIGGTAIALGLGYLLITK